MLAVEKIKKAMQQCERALKEIEDGDIRMAIGTLRHVEENAEEAVFILLSEVDEE